MPSLIEIPAPTTEISLYAK